MLRFKQGNLTTIMSRQVRRELRHRPLSSLLDMEMESLVNDKQRALIRSYSSNDKSMLLIAHGGNEGRVWTYDDNGRTRSVQRFIDNYDSEFSTIYLNVCNPAGLEISSEHSIIVAPNNDYSIINKGRGTVQTEIYIPPFGYIESYLYDHYLRNNPIK